MTIIRRILLAAALLVSAVPTFAQAPAPVPALPDTERRTSYSITASNCSCAVNFMLLGDGSDYQNWVEVWLNNVRVNYNDATFGWTITSPSGPIANLARPISNAVLTFNSVQTGTVQIVGARRPRRTSQFSENRGVAARDLNQALTDIIAQNREIWDKTNDMTGRGLFSRPGNTVGPLPLPSICGNNFLGFDSTGLNPVCITSSGSGNVVLPVGLGNIASFQTTGGLLTGSPSYQSSNPANASLYSTIANPANGYTTIFNGMQFSIGAPIPAGQQYAYNTIPIQQAVVGTVNVASGDTSGNGTGVAGYAVANQGAPAIALGVLGQASTPVANASVFGLNGIAINSNSISLVGNNLNYIAGAELDVNLWKVAGGADPTVSADNAYGLIIAGGGNIATPIGSAIGINAVNVAGLVPWNYGFRTYTGSAVTGISLGAVAAGNSQNSQPIALNGTNGSGVTKTARILADSLGDLILIPQNGLATVLQDGAGNTLLQTFASAGTLGVQLPKATVAGVITNDASGNLASSTTIPATMLPSAPIKASLGANVTMNNTTNYFDGPSVAQGSAGTWFASGMVTLSDTTSGAFFDVKLWDGTTVIASAQMQSQSANATLSISLSGYLANPAGNLRISAKDVTTTNGVMFFNASGNSKDSTISAYRIN